jgi:hypothetical protein
VIFKIFTRIYGFYSNKSGGLRKKAGVDDQLPALIEPEISTKKFHQNWARLIQKIYHDGIKYGRQVDSFFSHA